MSLKSLFKEAFSDIKDEMRPRHELDEANFNAVNMSLKSFIKDAFSDMKTDMQAQHELDKANFNAAKAEAKAQFEEAKSIPKQMRKARDIQRKTQIAEANQREIEAKKRIIDAQSH